MSRYTVAHWRGRLAHASKNVIGGKGMQSGRGVVFATAFAALALVAGPAAGEDGIMLELNKVAAKGEVCRLSFVLNNQSDTAFSEFRLQLAFFDAQGGVITDATVDFLKIRPQKTVVRYFDVPDLSCPGLAKVLLNDVAACAPPAPGGGDCLDLIEPSARGDVDFYK